MSKYISEIENITEAHIELVYSNKLCCNSRI